jgi:uncharacterized protein (DUF488 family)
MVRFYTIGYSGRSLDDLKAIMAKEDGAILDIRISPRSRKPDFNRKRLETTFGDRYLWTPAFGNAGLGTEEIELADPELGLRMIEAIYRDSIEDDWSGAVFLMCICKDPAGCHRSVVAQLMRDHGYEVTEYE